MLKRVALLATERQMSQVSTVEFIRNLGLHGDNALSVPIAIAKNDRDPLVLISIEQFDKLKSAYDAAQHGAIKTRSGVRSLPATRSQEWGELVFDRGGPRLPLCRQRPQKRCNRAVRGTSSPE